MKIGLCNLEPQYVNLAIEKLRVYYQQRGDQVNDCSPLEVVTFDKSYCSSIFTFTEKFALPAICGGTGYDLKIKLPPEIEAINPHKNIGFTTRGCFRWCPPCVVCKKEGGEVVKENSLEDIWDGKSKLVTLLDNNILGLSDWFEENSRFAQDHKIKLDHTQGLDHQLLTPKIARILADTPHAEYHFAFDKPTYRDSVEAAISMLHEVGINRSTWYLLVGFDTTFEQDLDRAEFLREHNQNGFIMEYRELPSTPKAKVVLDPRNAALKRWVNRRDWFQGLTFKEFVNRPENKCYLKMFKQTSAKNHEEK